MNTLVKIPICNVVACENIFISSNDRVNIYNPFTAISGKSIKSFFSYSIIQGVPNGSLTFKVQIISPSGVILKETGDNTSMVEENIVRIKTQWFNIIFSEAGEHIIAVYIKCNNYYEMVGSSYILVL